MTAILRCSIVLQTCWLVYYLGPSSCPVGPEVATELWPWETSYAYPSAVNIITSYACCGAEHCSVYCGSEEIRVLESDRPKLESWLYQLLVLKPWDKATFSILNFYIEKWVQ